MSDLLQSGQHPNADMLNAFAEQALPSHEYQETLAHLAHCPECRTIVALSLPVVEEAPQPVPARKPGFTLWNFSGWNLAWPAGAALAGLTFVVLYVQRAQFSTTHETQSSQVAVLREQPARPAPPAPQAAVVPPAAVRSAAKSTAPPSPAPLAAVSQPPLINSQAVSGMPIIGRNVLDLPDVAKPSHPAAMGRPASASRPDAEAAFRLPADAKVLSNTAPPVPVQNNSALDVQASPQSIESTNAVMTAPIVSPASAQVALPPANKLPSGLPTLSMTSEDHRVLAIDSHNALFLSEDDGQHWRPVPTQWSGHAVKVNLNVSRPKHVLGAGKAPAGFLGEANAPSGGAAMTGAAVAGAVLAVSPPAISGIVTDRVGATIPNATILLSNPGTQKTTKLKTDANGRYQASGLTPGTYQVEAEAPGFEKRVLSGLTISPNQTLQTNLTLDVGAATETVMVTADQVEVESPRAKKLPNAKTLRRLKAAPAATPSAGPVFEMLTDTGARWTSPDGEHWQPEPAQK